MIRYRIHIITVFVLLSLASLFYLKDLKFSFDFEQFFPQGDEDLAFFKEFVEDFEGDDNFMLVALVREEGVFDSLFLQEVHDFSLKSRTLPYVQQVQSLSMFSYPLKTPLAITSIPAIHLNQPERYQADKERILADERFLYNLINEDATALVVFLRTDAAMSLQQSQEHIAAIDSLAAQYSFPEVHLLGRSFFQQELVKMQYREVLVSAIASSILVCLILWLIYRRFWGMMVSMISVALGLLLFMGALAFAGRELNALSALYPVLMIIVGTSDVVHFMSKYIDELKKGHDKQAAMRLAVREVGLATFLTSITTAIGFATLLSSKVIPIRDFGINAAAGVLIAYVIVLFFTTALMSFFTVEQLTKESKGSSFWDRLLDKTYGFTLKKPRFITLSSIVLLLLSLWGISRITTNYDIISNMPRGSRITKDFLFFEDHLSGFRPMEFAISAKEDHKVNDYKVLKEMDKIEQKLKEYPFLRAVSSATAVYKTMQQMHRNNQVAAYTFPENEQTFNKYKRLLSKVKALDTNVLINKDATKARITSRIHDIGADTIKYFGQEMDQWVANNIDTNLISVKQTGTGLLIDKNATYIRQSLLQGLGLAVLIVACIMALLFRSWRMLFISLVPNFIPLLFAASLLGFLGIELDAGVSIVFAVIFGIAVDDSIHFLSKFKIARNKGLHVEAAIKTTFEETGKAIVLTSLILFFCFLVMLFSVHPPSVVIGLLISLTLLSAVIADLLLLPLLIRWLVKDE